MINKNKSTELNTTLQMAGIMPFDNSIELFADIKNKRSLWIQNGATHYFTDLPVAHYLLIKEEYYKWPKATAFISNVFPNSEKKQIELFAMYMYGDLDSTPDIKNGVLAPPENFRESRNCPSMFWDCKSMTIADYKLSHRQVLIIDLMSDDVPNKGIAATLGIQSTTLDFHIHKLFAAFGIRTRTALVILALQHKVIK
jgi:DNA-binding CsgD family transcriptional regulator